MPATHDTYEPRRQAIWPWLLMPVVVLLVALTLYHFKEVAQSATQTRSPASVTTSGPSEP